MSTHILKVGSENSHIRLDIFLAQTLADIPSRSFIKKLIEAGQVQVNKTCVKAHYKTRIGDEILVEIPEESLVLKDIQSENIPLDIFFEDEYLLVVNKSAGMLVHPAKGQYTGTLVNALLYYCERLSNPDEQGRSGIVHRLDKETSGLILVAKDNKTHAELAKQFQEHNVDKRYVALVEGEVEFDEGKIEAPLGEHLRYFDKRAVQFDDSAKEALTYYRVIKRFRGVSYVALYPKTGRTHQLRVHMAYLNHPILGDEKYGRKETFARLALHAQSIGFNHPRTKHFMEFSSMPPKEFLEKVGL